MHTKQGLSTYTVTTTHTDVDLGSYDAPSPRIAVRKALLDAGYDCKLHPDRPDALICRDRIPKHVAATTYRAGGETVEMVTVSEYTE